MTDAGHAALAGAPFIEGIGLSRAYGGVRALHNASLAVLPGEVHALVGENGAGKSTLIKVLGGRVRPDSGEIRLRGTSVSFSGPEAAHRVGVQTVFQELTLLPSLTVAENLFLSREPRSRLTHLIDRRAMGRRAEELLTGMGIDHIDPLAAVEDISLSERQLVEIVRAISHEPDILFLDEPTSSLVEREVVWLFEQIRRLRARGTAMVFTSHRWNEVRSIADRITVFRNGGDVGTFTDISEDDAVSLMTGRHVETLYPPVPALTASAPIALETHHLASAHLHDVSLQLHAGEILGVGGLAGHGHRALFFTLFGADRATSGTITVAGKQVSIRSPHDAMKRGVGIALVPEDRKTEGLLLRMSVRDNMTLAILRGRLSRMGFLRRAEEKRLSSDLSRQLRIKTAGPHIAVGSLSGGNQQKVLLGRWLLAEPRILLLYDVTRGVDVSTKAEIYALIHRLAAEGKAILFYSSDAEELAHLTHRVLVMREGRIAAALEGNAITAEAIVSAAVRDTSPASGRGTHAA
ncbi:sugar ABC transporter ATP-binding protein [Tanticharoenia sakaeratensis]|uniref:ABC transporter ATP-binding protein n=1 Tax=Tanticharoenia sakaeratensis NBRC 103193 TaxID=1231623 RepID=A0A0D6MHZ7_9PROT|nr:sugar ABC transporter ATP-binding protein [Tanticharoenia sakaeratensis]GAN53136.1 ABC transporter ATP-binding protein [Tanticharoenia sakaeratensis NBRC 103193]GBQ20598.1 ABC transporter [Tanticharoenia sakaeratensis NBRC 103193]